MDKGLYENLKVKATLILADMADQAVRVAHAIIISGKSIEEFRAEFDVCTCGKCDVEAEAKKETRIIGWELIDIMVNTKDQQWAQPALDRSDEWIERLIKFLAEEDAADAVSELVSHINLN